MVTDGNYTYGERYVMYVIIESLSCSSETNIMYINYISIKILLNDSKALPQRICDAHGKNKKSYWPQRLLE